MTGFLTQYDQDQTLILRAADDLRRGLPVYITPEKDTAVDTALIIYPLEFANSDTIEAFDTTVNSQDIDASNAQSFILITDHRAMALKVAPKGWPVVMLERPTWMTPADMVALADPTLDLSTPLKGPFRRHEQQPATDHQAALKLLKIARLLPAALICERVMTATAPHLMTVSADQILQFDNQQSSSLRQVASAHVPLAGSEKTRLFSFRPRTGGTEHIAILVGDPPRHTPVLTRLHSECFTGDLLGSMKCDCGEQLQGAIQAADQAGGGLILYMAQEGRGIGLTSKLKAYSLQDDGYDTVDANTALGFDVDERVFKPAAEMVKALGFDKIRLMTNNPNKVKDLQKAGLDVVERVPHKFTSNPHNEGYLAVKKAKTGHLL